MGGAERWSRSTNDRAWQWLDGARKTVRWGLNTILPSSTIEPKTFSIQVGSSNSKARSAYRHGRACMDKNVALYYKALEWFSNAIYYDGNFSRAWLGRAEVNTILKRFNEAENDFTK